MSADSRLQTQIMEAKSPPASRIWDWKLRMGKALEMDVKKNTLQWYPDGDDRIVRCECSCGLEELPMVLPDPATANMCETNLRLFSSDVFAAKNCSITTAMVLLKRRVYRSIIAINVFLKTRMERI